MLSVSCSELVWVMWLTANSWSGDVLTAQTWAQSAEQSPNPGLWLVTQHQPSTWSCRTTLCPWSRCPPRQSGWLDGGHSKTFLLHSFIIKSYGWGGVGGLGGCGGVLAHCIIVTAPVPRFRVWGSGDWGSGTGLVNWAQYIWHLT